MTIEFFEMRGAVPQAATRGFLNHLFENQIPEMMEKREIKSGDPPIELEKDDGNTIIRISTSEPDHNFGDVRVTYHGTGIRMTNEFAYNVQPREETMEYSRTLGYGDIVVIPVRLRDITGEQVVVRFVSNTKK